MKIGSLILLAVFSFFLFSCDDGIKFENSNDPDNKAKVQQGELGSECYPNNTCNDGLICDKDNNICIEESEKTNDMDKTDTVPENGDDEDDTPNSDESDDLHNDDDTPNSDSPETDTSYQEYCSAEFNGTDSRIEIPANSALNLAYDTWTIEAWIKQAAEDVTTDNIPLVRKGAATNSPVYLLTAYKKQQGWSGDESYGLMGYISYSYTMNMSTSEMTQSSTNQPSASSVTYSDDWSHIAMVHTKETSQGREEYTTYKLLLFLNGEIVASSDYKVNNTAVIPTVSTNDEALVIGANLNANFFFKGLMDSVKISNTAKYTENFTPSVLNADENTVAFWDFNGNTDDSSGNNLHGIVTNVTYSTDCK